MSELMNTLFGPLGGDQCNFFYFIMIFMFALFVMVIVSGFSLGITRGRNSMWYVSVIGASITYFVLYYISRLLYSMCSKSL